MNKTSWHILFCCYQVNFLNCYIKAILNLDNFRCSADMIVNFLKLVIQYIYPPVLLDNVLDIKHRAIGIQTHLPLSVVVAEPFPLVFCLAF